MNSLNLYSSLAFIHVLAATVLVGSSLFGPMTRRGLRRAASVGEARNWLTFEQRMTMANPIAALIVLATGLYLGSMGWWGFAWFITAVVLWVADTVVAVAVMKKTYGALEKSLVGDVTDPVPGPADRLRRSMALDIGGGFLLASDVAVLFLMLRKPGLELALGAVAAAFLVLGIVTVKLGRSRRVASAPAAATSAASAA